MKLTVWVGGILVVAGVLVVTGYGAYYFSRAFFGSSDVPLPLKVAIPAIVVGVLVLLGTVVLERLRHRKQEQFKEVEF